MKIIEKGIVLKRINYSETSQIVSIFTQSKGIKTYLYKGGKKKSALFPLLLCEFSSYQRNDSQLAQMSDCSSLAQNQQIVASPIKALIAFFVADVLLNCLPKEEEDESLFSFVQSWIKVLNLTDQVALFPSLFLAQLVSHIGYTPDLILNAKCFDIKEGVFLNYEKQDGYCIYGEEAENLLRLFNKEDIDPKYRQRMLKVLIDFCTIHIPQFDVSKSLDVVTTVLYD